MLSVLDVTSKRGESGSPTLTPGELNTAAGSIAKGQGETRGGQGQNRVPASSWTRCGSPGRELMQAEYLAHGLAYDAGCVRWSFSWKE